MIGQQLASRESVDPPHTQRPFAKKPGWLDRGTSAYATPVATPAAHHVNNPLPTPRKHDRQTSEVIMGTNLELNRVL